MYILSRFWNDIPPVRVPYVLLSIISVFALNSLTEVKEKKRTIKRNSVSQKEQVKQIHYKNCFHSSSLINDVCLVGKLSFRLGGGIKYIIINFFGWLTYEWLKENSEHVCYAVEYQAANEAGNHDHPAPATVCGSAGVTPIDSCPFFAKARGSLQNLFLLVVQSNTND